LFIISFGAIAKLPVTRLCANRADHCDSTNRRTNQRPENDQRTSEEIVMNALEQKRRSLVFGLGGLCISQVLPQGMARAQAATPQGYVLGANEGEHLVHFRDHGNIFIKVGSATRSDNLALGTL
jgi:hypothetical protein